MLHNVFYLLLQLCLATWAFAAPLAEDAITTTTTTAPWHYGAGGGIIGFIILVLDLIVFGTSTLLSPLCMISLLTTAAVEVIKSRRSGADKLIWCLVVFLFPVVGMIVYFLFSNRKAHNTYEPLP